MTTGVGLARARSSRHTSKPFLRGSVTSRITRSGAVEIAFARPSSPSDAVTTSYPSSSRLSRRPSNICGSSSITRIRFVTSKVSCIEREVQRERAAPARLTLDADEPAVAAHDVVHDRESEPGALRPRAGVAGYPIELPEDPPLQLRRNADPAVGDADDPVLPVARDLDRDVAVLRRILHRVRQQVFESLFGRFGIDQHRHLHDQLRGDGELIVLELAVERFED